MWEKQDPRGEDEGRVIRGRKQEDTGRCIQVKDYFKGHIIRKEGNTF